MRIRPVIGATLTLAALAVAVPVRAQTPVDTARETWSNDALRRELLEMERVDQAAREGFAQAFQAGDTTFLRRMMAVDSAHAGRLREILDAHGWPGRSLVGREGAHAAWLLAQHAPDDLQKRALALMQAAGPGEVAPADLAYLTDRVRVHEGKPQLYGTQFRIEGGVLVPEPLEDPERVDERRAAVGLGPLAEHYRQIEQGSGMTIRRPAPGGTPD
jgi:uncharacterized protein DUF6624